ARLGGDAGFAGPIGRVAATYLARATSVSGAEADDPEPCDADGERLPSAAAAPRPAQHGGAVSALLRQALREGLVRSAILTEDSGAGSPRAVLAATEAEVDACRGSKFAVTPVVAAVNRALAEGHEAVGVVALPCQATALAKMRAAGADVPVLPGGVSPTAGVSLVIGLFCTWALEQEGWSRLARERLGPGPYRRMDIPPPPAELLVAEASDGSRSEAPLAEVRALVRPGCRVCMDMTAENADVSVGMAETEPGWNTLMVRTPVGEALLAGAVAAGVLELRPTSEEGMAHLEAASLGKKRRAAAEADARVVGGKAAGAPDQGSPYLARVASWKAES
ncbi:MAG: Coenzyme F420 hydrogenase/dehydrogenase, beta subunit C-terminal domain, partial [Thermoleophilia bacterium]